MAKIKPIQSFRGAPDGINAEDFAEGQTYEVTADFARMCIDSGLARDADKPGKGGRKDQGAAPENKDLGGAPENKADS